MLGSCACETGGPYERANCSCGCRGGLFEDFDVPVDPASLTETECCQ